MTPISVTTQSADLARAYLATHRNASRDEVNGYLASQQRLPLPLVPYLRVKTEVQLELENRV